MKNRIPPFFHIALLIFVTLACSYGNPGLQKLETGSTQTLTFNEPLPNTKNVQDVTLSMAVADFNLSGGAGALLEGEIHYNVQEWKPTIKNRGNSLTVSQGESNNTLRGIPEKDVVNRWDIKLGNIPMNLILTAAVYEGTLDLSGLPIQSLVVQEGASTSEIRFDTLNPTKMQIAYQTGASEISFLGLANANLTEMNFEGGAGKYTFDFSGDLQHNASVNIQAFLSDIHIRVPTGVYAQVSVDGGMHNLSVEGAWTGENDSFENEGSGPQLTIVVEMDAGELRLTNE